MDMASIQAAATSLNAAVSIANGLLQLKVSAEVQGKISELNAKILAAQASALTANAEQFALLQKVRELEEENRRMKAWETEKQKYELKEFVRGRFCYGLKKEAQSTEPEHHLCTNCYEHGAKSILQEQFGDMTLRIVICPKCQMKLTYR